MNEIALPEPLALKSALSRAVRNHPYAAAGDWDSNSERLVADATALWDRLVGYEAEQRRRAVIRLTAFELRLIILTARTRLSDASCLAVLDEVFVEHKLSEASQLAWEAFLLTDGRASFRDPARRHCEKVEPRSPACRMLTLDGSPTQAACRLYLGGTDSFSRFWGSLPRLIRDVVPFAERVKFALISDSQYIGTVDERESSESVLQWSAESIPSIERDGWELRFLRSSFQKRGLRRWGAHPWPTQHAVLSAIHSHHGEPQSSHAFWSRLESPVRDAYACWLRDQDLTRLLGENDRVQFWRAYLRWLVRSEANRDSDVVFIYFDRWFAVQFKNAGTATYIFENKDFRKELLRMDEMSLARWVRSNRRALSSYEHRGNTDTWQRNAADVVQSVREYFVARGY